MNSKQPETENRRTNHTHLVLFPPFLSHELEHAGVGHDRDQTQPVSQDLVVDDRRVHEHVHVLDSHRRHLRHAGGGGGAGGGADNKI